jgi:hypothetical protein
MLANTTNLVAAAPRPARNTESGRDIAIGAASDRGRAVKQSDAPPRQKASAAPPRKQIQPGDKLAFTIDEAVQSSSLGQTSIYQAIKDKKLIMRKYGSRSVITRGDLVAFLNGLPVSE